MNEQQHKRIGHDITLRHIDDHACKHYLSIVKSHFKDVAFQDVIQKWRLLTEDEADNSRTLAERDALIFQLLKMSSSRIEAARRELAANAVGDPPVICSIHARRGAIIEESRRLGRFLPRQVRERVLLPYIEELRADFINSSQGCLTEAEFERKAREFRHAVRTAVAQSVGASAKETLQRGFLFVVASVAGDGVVRLVYWMCRDIIRFL